VGSPRIIGRRLIFDPQASVNSSHNNSAMQPGYTNILGGSTFENTVNDAYMKRQRNTVFADKRFSNKTYGTKLGQPRNT